MSHSRACRSQFTARQRAETAFDTYIYLGLKFLSYTLKICESMQV